MTAQFLAWFGLPRSGTNYLSDLLDNFSCIESYREIFQPGGVHLYNGNTPPDTLSETLEALSDRFGLHRSKGVRDAEFVRAVHSYPLEFLDLLCDRNPGKIISFKVFPGHLDVAGLDALLSHPSVIPLVITRDPLDSFISESKAKALSNFIGVDTTLIRPQLRWEEYKRWRASRREWLSYISDHDAKFVGWLEYGDLMARGRSAEQFMFLSAAFKAMNIVVGEAKYSEIRTKTWRQDRSEKPADKVRNWLSFSMLATLAGEPPSREPVALRVKSFLEYAA